MNKLLELKDNTIMFHPDLDIVKKDIEYVNIVDIIDTGKSISNLWGLLKRYQLVIIGPKGALIYRDIPKKDINKIEQYRTQVKVVQERISELTNLLSASKKLFQSESVFTRRDNTVVATDKNSYLNHLLLKSDIDLNSPDFINFPLKTSDPDFKSIVYFDRKRNLFYFVTSDGEFVYTTRYTKFGIYNFDNQVVLKLSFTHKSIDFIITDEIMNSPLWKENMFPTLFDISRRVKTNIKFEADYPDIITPYFGLSINNYQNKIILGTGAYFNSFSYDEIEEIVFKSSRHGEVLERPILHIHLKGSGVKKLADNVLTFDIHKDYYRDIRGFQNKVDRARTRLRKEIK